MEYLVLLMLPAVSLQCFTPGENILPMDPNARLDLYKGQQQFSLDLFRTLNSLTPAENVFFSPFSIYSALVLSYFVSANHTEAALKKFLHLPPQQDKISTMRAYKLEKSYQQLRQINGSDSYQLSSANRLFVSDKEPVMECMETLFDSEIGKIDFEGDPEGAVRVINDWVAQQTRNQIDKLLSPGSLTKYTRLVLTNAAYFKGIWKSKFPPENTKNDIFYMNSSQYSHVKMMRQKGTFNHLVSEKIGAHILELPYKKEDVSMFILLPPFANANGVTAVLDRLNLDAFQEMVTEDSLIPRSMDISIPKFTIEHEVEGLANILQQMGVGDLFQPTADLSSLTGRPGLGLDDAVHKAKVRFDEEGTTAAAATAFFNFRSSRPLEPAKFEANHPFIYILFDKISQTILFMGVYNKPTEKLA